MTRTRTTSRRTSSSRTRRPRPSRRARRQRLPNPSRAPPSGPRARPEALARGDEERGEDRRLTMVARQRARMMAAGRPSTFDASVVEHAAFTTNFVDLCDQVEVGWARSDGEGDGRARPPATGTKLRPPAHPSRTRPQPRLALTTATPRLAERRPSDLADDPFVSSEAWPAGGSAGNRLTPLRATRPLRRAAQQTAYPLPRPQ
jgi:hypothetical protein